MKYIQETERNGTRINVLTVEDETEQTISLTVGANTIICTKDVATDVATLMLTAVNKLSYYWKPKVVETMSLLAGEVEDAEEI